MVEIIVNNNLEPIIEIDDRTFCRDGTFSVITQTPEREPKTSFYEVGEGKIKKFK